MIEDYDLIESSFAQQYGIRLRTTEMKWDEFLTLLVGLNGETPLGRIIQIRSENNPENLKNFTPEMRKIRNDWMERQMQNISENDYKKAMENLSLMFKGFNK